MINYKMGIVLDQTSHLSSKTSQQQTTPLQNGPKIQKPFVKLNENSIIENQTIRKGATGVSGNNGAEFAANNTDSSSTLASPFLANSGQHPRMGFEPAEPLPENISTQARANLIAANKFADRMQKLDSHLRDEMLIAQAIYESNANANCRPCPRYSVGDMVWLNTKNIQTARPTVKLDDRNIGPYRVNRVFPNNPLIVQLELPETVKIHPVFHVNLLQHDPADPLPGQHPAPRDPVIAEDGQREWYVNSILNSKYDRRYQPPLLQYFVIWEGHTPT